MNGDVLNLTPAIIRYNSDINEIKQVPQALFFATGEGANYNLNETLFRADIIDVAKVVKPNEIDDVLRGAFNGIQSTEMKHVKAVEENFTFKNYNIITKHNTSHLAPNSSDKLKFDVQVVNRLTVDYDQRAYSGTTQNLGYFSNLNNAVAGDESVANVDIAIIDDLISLMASMAREIATRCHCPENQVRFVLSGTNLYNFLFRMTGLYPRTNKTVIEENFGMEWTNGLGRWIMLRQNVYAVDKISAYAPSYVNYHSSFLPSVFKEGSNEEFFYDYTQYITGANAVNIIEYGSAIYKNITITQPTS